MGCGGFVWLFGRYSGFGEINRCGGSVVCLFCYFSLNSYCLWFGNLIVSLGFVSFLVVPQDVRVLDPLKFPPAPPAPKQ